MVLHQKFPGNIWLAWKRSGAHHWTNPLWSRCKVGSCDTNMSTDSPLKCIEAFSRETEIVLSQAATPIDVCFSACSLTAGTFINLTLFSAELCRRMSLRQCQIVEHLGWKSQRDRHLERKRCLCVFPGKLGPDIYCETAEPRWALKNYLAQLSASRRAFVNL